VAGKRREAVGRQPVLLIVRVQGHVKREEGFKTATASPVNHHFTAAGDSLLLRLVILRRRARSLFIVGAFDNFQTACGSGGRAVFGHVWGFGAAKGRGGKGR
jgi:hypothetical protein